MQRSQWKKWSVLTYFTVAQVTFSSCFAETSGKEALAVRRIIEFWKDKDLKITQKQIIDFLNEYPKSDAIDQLHVMLGDLYFEQKKYQEAHAAYESIKDPHFKEKTLFSSLYCLFQLKDFPAVIELSERYFSTPKEGKDALNAHAVALEAYVHTALKTADLSAQTHLAEKALSHYQSLDATKEPHLLFFLAEIQRILKHYPDAISSYLNLAEKYPEKKEDLLFQAAQLQVLVDKSEAIKTFDFLASQEGKTSKAAAFNQLILLYQTQHFEEFLSLFQIRSIQIPENKASLLQLYLGKSHYALTHYSEACAPLLNYIQTTQVKSEQLKSALICLIDSTYMIKDLPLLEASLEKIKVLFPQDAYYPQTLLFRAHLYLEKKDYHLASLDLNEIRKQFPHFGNREELLFTAGYLSLKQENWNESHQLFLQLLEEFPTTSYEETARRHLVNASLKLNNKELLAIDLHSLLKKTSSLALEEKRELQLLLAKTLYEIGKYPSAIEELDHYLNEYSNHSTTGEAHLLSALCHQKLSLEAAFIEHAEKALSLHSELPQKGLLHLHLYNAYLKLKDEERAAQHLLLGFLSEEAEVKEENQIWLANYLYQKGESPRACIIFEKILKSKNPEPVTEELFLKYASLLHTLKRHREEVNLLKNLVNSQENHLELPWKYLRRSLFELAKAHEELEENGLALIIYDSLIQSPTLASSYIGAESFLRRARLEYQLLKEEEKNENDPRCVAVLSALKELQIKKNIQSEPIHLEAALDYAEMRASLAPLEQKKEKLLFFLNRVKEDFSSEEDILSKEYKVSRKEFAEKDALFHTYMRYLEAQIMFLEGREEEAKEECQELTSLPLHPYLKERIKKILNDE